MELLSGQLHVWQMGVDLCLVTAILIFSFRWIKGDRAQALMPRTMELESSLRALIQEADGAGRHLNDQLLRREQNLQKLLADVDAIDQKIQRDISASEQAIGELTREQEKARSLVSEVREVLHEFKGQLQGESAPSRRAHEEYRPMPPRREERYEPMPAPRPERAPVHHAIPRADEYQRPSHGEHYGARYQQVEQPAAMSPQPRTQTYRDNMGHRELQQVYAAAETMLKEGKQLEQVSAHTRLPVEEIRLLSQMIEVERDEEARKTPQRRSQPERPADDRLGALGAIRRHNATL